MAAQDGIIYFIIFQLQWTNQMAAQVAVIFIVFQFYLTLQMAAQVFESNISLPQVIRFLNLNWLDPKSEPYTNLSLPQANWC